MKHKSEKQIFDSLTSDNKLMKNSLKLIISKRKSAGWDSECSALVAEETLKKLEL